MSKKTFVVKWLEEHEEEVIASDVDEAISKAIPNDVDAFDIRVYDSKGNIVEER